jgi:hypothetical protein
MFPKVFADQIGKSIVSPYKYKDSNNDMGHKFTAYVYGWNER